MTKPSQHGRADGATIAVIGVGILFVLLAAIITTGVVMSRRLAIPEDVEGLTAAEAAEQSRKLQAEAKQAEAKALGARTQPAATLPVDPRIRELEGRLGALSDRAAELEARLEELLKSSTRPSTLPATSRPTFPTTPETPPTVPVTAPADK